MVIDDFRRLALACPGAAEGEHMRHPDFRAGGRIFATIPDPGQNRGMVALTPEQQGEFMAGDPTVFVPVKGAWGRQGATYVVLDRADVDVVGRAVHAAWRNKTESQPRRRRK